MLVLPPFFLASLNVQGGGVILKRNINFFFPVCAWLDQSRAPKHTNQLLQICKVTKLPPPDM